MLNNIFSLGGIFSLAPNDASVCYLYGIFGNGVFGSATSQQELLQSVNCTTAAGFPTLLGAMFGYFNSVILAVGALVVVYVTVIGVMNTAHEGKFMGKEWNNLWVPMRMVLGITALVPTSSGYSYLQIIMMWAIIQGIGAADGLWNVATQNMANIPNNQNVAPITPPSTNTMQSMQQLTIGLICAMTAHQTFNTVYPPGSTTDNAYFCAVNSKDPFCQSSPPYLSTSAGAVTLTPGGTLPLGPGGGACGTLVYCNVTNACKVGGAAGTSDKTAPNFDPNAGPGTAECQTCNQSVAALEAIIPVIANLAQVYVQTDYEYINYWQNTPPPSESQSLTPSSAVGTPSEPPQLYQFISDYCSANSLSPCDNTTLPSPFTGNSPNNTPDQIVNNIYWPALQKASGIGQNPIQAFVTQYNSGITGVMNSVVSSQNAANTTSAAVSKGWILAGAYYLTMTSIGAANVQASAPTFTVSIDSKLQPDTSSSPLYNMRSNYDAASTLMNDASGATSSGTDSSVSQSSSPMQNGGSDSQTVLTNATSTNSGTNPLIQIATAGWALLLVAQVVYVVLLAVAIILGIVGGIDIFIFGTGVTNPFGDVFTFIYYLLIPLVFLFLSILVTLGATLGVYVPMIPYLVFTMGAIGWLFSTIEAMVAGPLVALGILSPSSHHEVLGKAEPALMLLFAIFLRPSLMIFGMVAAMLLSIVVLTFINAGFGTATSTLGVGNPLALIFVLVAYVTLIITSLNKCFASIYLIPDRVMGWIGHHGASGGEAEALGEVKGAVGGAAGKADKTMSSGTQRTSKASGAMGKEQKDQNSKAKISKGE